MHVTLNLIIYTCYLHLRYTEMTHITEQSASMPQTTFQLNVSGSFKRICTDNIHINRHVHFDIARLIVLQNLLPNNVMQVQSCYAQIYSQNILNVKFI
jgi:hypothetical protein